VGVKFLGEKRWHQELKVTVMTRSAHAVSEEAAQKETERPLPNWGPHLVTSFVMHMLTAQVKCQQCLVHQVIPDWA
jgi:hypothetical protein